MLIIREIMHCKPGKVRPLAEKFLKLAEITEREGLGSMRVMTDVSGEQFWTLVAEVEVPSLEAFQNFDKNEGVARQFGEIMTGYHDLVASGRREIYKLENSGQS